MDFKLAHNRVVGEFLIQHNLKNLRRTRPNATCIPTEPTQNALLILNFTINRSDELAFSIKSCKNSRESRKVLVGYLYIFILILKNMF